MRRGGGLRPRVRLRRWPGVAVGSALRRALSERSGLLVNVGFYLVIASVLTSLWHKAAAGHAGGTLVGYSPRAIAWYIVTSEACTIALHARLVAEIGADIGSGAVTVELLRPASVLGVRVMSELGRALPRLLACLVVGWVLAWAAAGPPPHAGLVLLSLPAALLGVVANLFAQHAFAGISFWMRDASSSWFLYSKLVFMLGGTVLPLEVLPHALRTVARATPFAAMAYAPGRLASGHAEVWWLAVQCGWIAVLALVAGLVFRSGERRLQVVGG